MDSTSRASQVPHRVSLTARACRFLYTTGDEGYMRIFDASGSGSEAARNPILVEQYEEPVTSVSTSVSSPARSRRRAEH